MYQRSISSFVKKRNRKYAVTHSKETSRFRLLWERPAAREHRSAPDERHNTSPDNRTSFHRLRHTVAAFYIYITIIPVLRKIIRTGRKTLTLHILICSYSPHRHTLNASRHHFPLLPPEKKKFPRRFFISSGEFRTFRSVSVAESTQRVLIYATALTWFVISFTSVSTFII